MYIKPPRKFTFTASKLHNSQYLISYWLLILSVLIWSSCFGSLINHFPGQVTLITPGVMFVNVHLSPLYLLALGISFLLTEAHKPEILKPSVKQNLSKRKPQSPQPCAEANKPLNKITLQIKAGSCLICPPATRARCRSSWMTCLRRCSARCTGAVPCPWPSSTCLTSWTSRRTSTASTTPTSGTPGRATGNGGKEANPGDSGQKMMWGIVLGWAGNGQAPKKDTKLFCSQGGSLGALPVFTGC